MQKSVEIKRDNIGNNRKVLATHMVTPRLFSLTHSLIRSINSLSTQLVMHYIFFQCLVQIKIIEAFYPSFFAIYAQIIDNNSLARLWCSLSNLSRIFN